MVANPIVFNWTNAESVYTRILWSVVFAGLTALAAQLRITLPFTPVPVTFQTLLVFSSGLFLGPQYGLLSQAVYLVLGIVGLPVFQGGNGGVTYLAGPTAGYLFGFLAYSYFSGLFFYSLKVHRSAFFEMLVIYFLSVFCIFLPGVTMLKLQMDVSWEQAIALGLTPFIIGDIFKVIASVTVARKMRITL